MSRTSRGRRADETGTVAIMVTILATVLLVMAALVVNLGQARDTNTQAQTAADAAALAGANALYLHSNAADTAAAVAAVKASAAANMGTTGAQWASCTDPDRSAGFTQIGSDQCISLKLVSDSQGRVIDSYLRVRIPPTVVKTPFAAVIGVTSVPVGAAAEVRANRTPTMKCFICIMGTGTHNLQNGNLVATNTGIHFNGSVTMNPNGSVTATDLDPTDFNDVRISYQTAFSGGTTNLTPTKVAQQPDPLAFLKMPFDWSGLPVRGTSDPCANGPGIYGGPLNFNGSCTLTPGLYVIAGGSSATWSISGSGFINAPGSTLYFVCGAPSAPRTCNAGGEAGASLNAAGGGGISISAPTSGPLQGMSIAYDRNNTSPLGFKGGSGGASGTMYALSSQFSYGGNAGGQGFDSLIVAGDLSFNGNNATLATEYSPDKNVPFPAVLNLSK